MKYFLALLLLALSGCAASGVKFKLGSPIVNVEFGAGKIDSRDEKHEDTKK